MANSKERAQQRREARLAEVQQQIDDGTLTIRKMTAKERAENPAKPRPEHGRGRRRQYG
jgi:hypothetical protein